MRLGYLELKGQDINTRVDVDSYKDLGGGMISYDDYSGKAKVKRGQIIVPVLNVVSLTIKEDIVAAG